MLELKYRVEKISKIKGVEDELFLFFFSTRSYSMTQHKLAHMYCNFQYQEVIVRFSSRLFLSLLSINLWERLF